jgi:hypothetical protein
MITVVETIAGEITEIEIGDKIDQDLSNVFKAANYRGFFIITTNNIRVKQYINSVKDYKTKRLK